MSHFYVFQECLSYICEKYPRRIQTMRFRSIECKLEIIWAKTTQPRLTFGFNIKRIYMRLYLLNIEQIFFFLNVFLLHIIFDMQHILWVYFHTITTKSKEKIISSITLLEICPGSVCGILSYYLCETNHCQNRTCLMDAWN